MSTPKYKRLQNGATGTGNGLFFDVGGMEGIALQITGITTATIQFEGSIDGSTFANVPFFNSAGANASSATANGIFVTNLTGYQLLRARISAYTSGTIIVDASGC